MSDEMGLNGEGGWYNAVLRLEALVPDELDPEDPLIERSVVLFYGANESEIRSKAAAYCQEYSLEYESAAGNHVRWVCTSVTAVNELFLKEIGDGSEVFSEFLPAAIAEKDPL